MDIPALYQLFLESTGVSTDTRKIQPGNLYFALKGDNFDGNAFAEKALKSGADYAVVDDLKFKSSGDKRFIFVENALEALQQLALHHRKQFRIPVIGLTGSNGKTTSKELLAAALRPRYKVGFTQGNLNNHIGVPLTLLNLTNDREIAIIEMGANHQKEIEFLSSICLPDHGFITNYGKAHLEGFGGVQGIIKGKSELYANLRERGKTAWINCVDEEQKKQSQGIATRYYFGDCEDADYPVQKLPATDEGMVRVRFEGLEVTTQLTGDYNFSNIAVAVAIARYFGVADHLIKEGLEAYEPANNRSQVATAGSNVIYKDYYNANPDSMQAAIENFAKVKAQAKWVILGDMFELGEESAHEHQLIADMLAQYAFEKVILVGKAFQKVSLNCTKVATTEEAWAIIRELKPEHKTMLIKGSRGMTLEKVAEELANISG